MEQVIFKYLRAEPEDHYFLLVIINYCHFLGNFLDQVLNDIDFSHKKRNCCHCLGKQVDSLLVRLKLWNTLMFEKQSIFYSFASSMIQYFFSWDSPIFKFKTCRWQRCLNIELLRNISVNTLWWILLIWGF